MLRKILSLLGIAAEKEYSVQEATMTSVFYIVAALLFAGGMFVLRGATAALEFMAGYLVEKALSIDNLFVFMMLFSLFGVSTRDQRRILSLGIVGALVLRGAMIAVGSMLLHAFPALSYLFGGFLIFTAYKMLVQSETEDVNPNGNPLVRLVTRVLPLADGYDGEGFFVRQAGRLLATPLFLVLIIVEITDVMFAFDSIPAVLAVTRDPFIVLMSNAFAVMGLRAMYFVVAGLLERLRYLKPALAVVLTFVGMKMLLSNAYEIPVAVSLLVTVAILAVAVALSQIGNVALTRRAIN
jgi:tellurite resistance protein TerC